MGAATSDVYAVVDDRVVPHGAVAFEALYREHASFTWSCLRRLGVPSATVDDAMQELWVTAHRRIDTLRSQGVTRAWLFGIARRIASHHRRTEQRHRRRVDAFVEHAPQMADPERESSLVVESILASLDERVREAFVLSELEGWSAAEISAATGANTNTIYWRVRTARHQLQAQLADGDLDARVIALRERTKPSRKSIAHCWMMVVPQLGQPAATAGLFGLWSVAKIAVLGATATVAVATGIDVGIDRGPERTTAPIVARAEQPEADRVVAGAVASGSVASVAVLPAAIAPTPIATPEPAPTLPSPSRAAPRAATTAAAPAVTPEANLAEHDVAAEEASMLADLKAELAAGRTARASSLLDQHRAQFPESRLADVRAAISIELACTTGELSRGRAELATWRTRLGTTKSARLDVMCAAKDVP